MGMNYVVRMFELWEEKCWGGVFSDTGEINEKGGGR